MLNTLISTQDLASNMKNDDYLVVDCRFDLANTDYGSSAYNESHIPGAIYAHLDNDLSGMIISGKTGRHPLPEPSDLIELFSSWGINENTQVVVYDDVAGPFAARLWWMLRWMGHNNVAVLNGGLKKWLAEDKKVSAEQKTLSKSDFKVKINEEMRCDVQAVLAAMGNDKIRLIDARPGDRFCGQNETMDPKAGHIPGAISAPFFANLTENGTLKESADLINLFSEKLGDHKPEDIIMYCGSGVTASHNILAMEYCGLTGVKNYVGSWSEWVTDDSRPIETC